MAKAQRAWLVVVRTWQMSGVHPHKAAVYFRTLPISGSAPSQFCCVSSEMHAQRCHSHLGINNFSLVPSLIDFLIATVVQLMMRHLPHTRFLFLYSCIFLKSTFRHLVKLTVLAKA